MSSSAAPRYYRSQAEMPPELVVQVEKSAFELGETYDSYLVTQSDREYLVSADGESLIGFTRIGKDVLVTGGLLAKSENQERFLTEVLAYVKSRGWRITFFNASRVACRLFRQHGFQITKCGEEPIVRLDQTDWRGKDYEWLRRQENFCQRQGVTLREVNPQSAEYKERIAPELEIISNEHIKNTLHQREMGFFVGLFDAHALKRQRLFIAEAAGRVECFVVLNPCLAGSMWAIEIYRQREGAVRGVVPAAMLMIMRQLKQEGVRYVSLSLVPFLRCEMVLKNDSFVARSAVVFSWRHLNFIFDVRGIYHFKSRFRPYYREMYFAASPRVGVRTLLAIALSWKLFHFNPFRLLAQLWRNRGSKARDSLAEPEIRPTKVIRDLIRDDVNHSAADANDEKQAEAGQP